MCWWQSLWIAAGNKQFIPRAGAPSHRELLSAPLHRGPTSYTSYYCHNTSAGMFPLWIRKRWLRSMLSKCTPRRSIRKTGSSLVLLRMFRISVTDGESFLISTSFHFVQSDRSCVEIWKNRMQWYNMFLCGNFRLD